MKWNSIESVIVKSFIYIGLLIGVYILYKYLLQRGYYAGALLACFPFLLIAAFYVFKNPLWSFIVLFTANYFVMGAARYISFKAGIVMDELVILVIVSLIIQLFYKRNEWRRAANPLTFLTFVWTLFCILELLNPEAVAFADWLSAVRTMAFYPFITVIFVSVLCKRYNHLKIILLLWSVFTLLGAAKGYWQKNHGFDTEELFWLYVKGGARTHLIVTGIRFFSFFTDAGNFGSSMGFSMVVFSLVAVFIKNKWLKCYFLIVALAGGYGMVISGTRGALAVPFAGYALFVILSKNWKMCISGVIIIIALLCFFNLTTIGDNNRFIHRMRTAFDQNDPSFQARLNNQKVMKEYMANFPLGIGIGADGESVNQSDPLYKLAAMPKDSWFVKIWVFTGIYGLIFYLILLSATIIIGGYIILFKIKNKELGGILAAMLAGTFGMMASAYGNEIYTQFPNAILIYTCQTFVFMGMYYDKELEEKENEKKQKLLTSEANEQSA